jgi:hypothetical protein
VERSALRETSLDDPLLLRAARIDASSCGEKLGDLIEVPRRHRSDERHLMLQTPDQLDGRLAIRPSVLGEIRPQQPESLGDTRRHRLLDAIAVALVLIDHDLGDEQHEALLCLHHQTDRHDPLLSVPALGDIEPGTCIDE